MSTPSTPKSKKKSVPNETPAKKVIKLPYDANNLFVPADQLRKVPKREDDQYAAGDLVWAKTKGFPWWPCIITVDPETGKYSKIVAIRDKNDKAFHVQYFGQRAFRGYTQGNIMEYEGKKKYELKLDQIKNTPTPNKSQRKMELTNYEIKHTFKKDWNIASAQADEAMKLDRAERIETLTFEYILDRPKSTIKKVSVEEPQSSVTSTPKSGGKKRKSESQGPKVSKSFSKSTAKRKKKAGDFKSSPTDVYYFNEFSEEFQADVTPSKPFELSSAKRAKGEYAVYAKKLRAEIEKENPDLDEEEVEAKLKRNWQLMSDDMRNDYAPRPSLFQNLSFQLDASLHETSLNDEEIPIPDLNMNNSMKTKSSSKLNSKSSKSNNKSIKRQKTEKPAPEPKTHSGRRGRSKAKEEETIAETNGLDEKENAMESEELETEAVVEENVKDEGIVSMTRSSPRKKLFNQSNETNETTNEDTTNNTPKRQSARMRSRTSVEPEKTKSPAPSAKSSSLKSTSKAPTPSTRSSRRQSAANSGDSLMPAVDLNSIHKKEPVVANNQLVEEANGISEDSVSCSSESEKTEQQKEASEESKEMTCAKCLESDKGLIKCDGECLSHFHKECLHQDS